MPPEANDAACILDMLRAARGALGALRSVTFEQYLANEEMRLAHERRLEIMGEAARQISVALREKHPEIPWRGIIAQRNVLIHAYATIQSNLVWQLAESHLPALVPQLEEILRELGFEKDI